MRRLRAIMGILSILLLTSALSACDVRQIEGPDLGDGSSSQDDVDTTDGDGPDQGNPGGPGDPGDLDLRPYPRVASFIDTWEWYDTEHQANIARYDAVAYQGSPEGLEALHRMNPDARVFYRVMPQCIPGADWGTDHNWMDLVRRYAEPNDWILLHDDGTEAVAKGWGTYWRWGDYTEHCPEGTVFDPEIPELDSRGLTLAEWMATRFIPWFVENRLSVGYEGLWWEVIAAEANRYWWYHDTPFEGAMLDWNRNGIADDDEPGDQFEAFKASWQATTAWWLDETRARIGWDLPIIGGGDGFAPELSYLHGFKNEDFLNRNFWTSPYWDWWSEFYGRGSDPRRGYRAQRTRCISGWDLSMNQMFWRSDEHWHFDDPDEYLRHIRFGLGTTLLGDGYFLFYDKDHRAPGGGVWNRWVPEYYDLELGVRADPFRKQVFGADTLYTRTFRDAAGEITGYVAVNPFDHEVGGVPAEDAVIEAY